MKAGAMAINGQRHLWRRASGAVLALAVALAVTGCGKAASADSSSARVANAPLVEVYDTDTETEELETAAPDSAEQQTATPSTAQTALDAAVADLEAQGTTVGYIVLDLDTGETLEHDADAIFYSASSVKAPYCVSLLRAKGSEARTAHEASIRACVVDSSNDDFDTLHHAYLGQSFFPDFAAQAGIAVDVSDRGGYWYPYYSVRDLARLWAASAEWLAAGSDDAVWLGELLGDTLYSQVDDYAGGEGITTWSKAGWFWEAEYEDPVTIDGGAVQTPAGGYAIAVAVDRGSDFDAVRSVMEPLVTVWNERQGDA